MTLQLQTCPSSPTRQTPAAVLSTPAGGLGGANGLRWYQQEAIQQTERALREDPDRVQVISLPTGAGKTRVATVVALRFLDQQPDGKVLWLANRWELARQAASGVRASGRITPQQIAKIGDGLTDIQARHQAKLQFSTVQTWCSRSKNRKTPAELSKGPLLVVIDECHWAFDAQMGSQLLSEFRGKASIIGLSATPKVEATTHNVAYAKSYAELCPEYLAAPTIRQVATGEEWNPIFSGNDISSSSLRDLGSRDERNSMIVDTFLEGQQDGTINRSVIFACDVRHANELNQRLSRKGVACRAVHSSKKSDENRQAIDDFRKGIVEVLVTVEMLTEGFDVPEIDTILIARPTSSLALLAQMVGRGARKTDRKKSFTVIEFTDSIKRIGSGLFHAKDYLGSTEATSQRALHIAGGGSRRHAEPEDTPKFEVLSIDDVQGIPFTRDQTFGVEIELAESEGSSCSDSPEWDGTAKRIIACIQDVARLPVYDEPLEYHESNDTAKWRVTSDESCGWEVVSPILVNADGFSELVRVSKAIDDLVAESSNLCVNTRTGLHITLATRLNTPERRIGFASRLSRLEAGLYTLVAPSRLFEWVGPMQYYNRGRNGYCRPVRELPPDVFQSLEQNWPNSSRYHSVNLRRMKYDVQLLEVRMHQGTTEYQKIIPWISLWMQIFNHARYDWEGRPALGRVHLGGNNAIARQDVLDEDIFGLLDREGIVLPSPLKRMLWERRRQLRSSWKHAVPRRVKVWDDAGWYAQQR